MEALRKRKIAMLTSLALGAGALSGCSAVGSEVTPRIVQAEDEEPLFYIPEECDIELPDVEVPPESSTDAPSKPPKDEDEVREDQANSHSPMENNANPVAKVLNGIDTLQYFSSELFEKNQEFEARDTGLTVAVYSETPSVHVDEHAFSNLLLMPLDYASSFKQPNLRQQMECFRQSVLFEGQLEGKTLNVYIPTDSGLCFTENYALADIEHCQNRKEAHDDYEYYLGLTPPQISLTNDFFELSQDKSVYSMFLLGGHTDPNTAGSRVDTMTIHEDGHFYVWAHGGPLPIKGNDLEAPVEEMEEELGRLRKERGISLSRAVFYN